MYDRKKAEADVGWMTLFSSTIAIAERWTDKASSTLRQAASALSHLTVNAWLWLVSVNGFYA
ncbi:hypothetical protein [Phytopseudomonas daroniae]|uniref:hypothetical protein n=1 Tax=Phytopseudomonas daroniae TaxID=2487519 RepID=UPI0010384678|nr:hypothetical protein [Pseudomonas daroniae]TBU78906.1 hypothetical protein DNK10_04010 [Pseudomonas daroniae]